ncbi:MAG: BadM/Rrf2 family transcriptional regulator [Gammaproteobacteria bacterium]|nr:BadM/Rrf2 family transcriptional regulator [Gammaproteobacteria bacterium]
MQLNKQTDYALRVLLFLGTLPQEQLATIDLISEKFHIARNHLIKIVSKLAKLKYIETIKGKGGGMKIRPATLSLKLDTIIKSFEPTFEVIDCEHNDCPIRGMCRLKRVLDLASTAFLAVLSQYKLSQLLPQSFNEGKDWGNQLNIPIKIL